MIDARPDGRRRDLRPVGGGFARYSTDGAWHVPHFEKMLYDNAQLARLYTRAWQVTRRGAATDAWRPRRSSTCCARCGTPRAGSSRRRTPTPRASKGSSSCGRGTSWSRSSATGGGGMLRRRRRAATGRGRTCCGARRDRGVAARARPRPPTSSRPRSRTPDGRCSRSASGACSPATDDKVLAAWNALAIGALAEAGRAFGEPSLRGGGGALRGVRPRRTCATSAAGCCAPGGTARPGGRAFADDHAMMAAACLTLYETTFELRWFEDARDAGRRAAPPVPRRRTRRLLPDGLRRRGARASPEGAVRQRAPVRELGGGGDAAAPRARSPATRRTSERGRLRAAPGPRRDGGGADRVRPGALRARPATWARRTRWRSSATPTAAETRALVARRSRTTAYRPNIVLAVAAPDDEPARSTPSRCSATATHGTVSPTAYVCERFTCKLPVHRPSQRSANSSES